MSQIRPTFLVIGAMKAGTTSLAVYLKGHPEVGMSREKEPHYFTRNFERGLDWYLSLFEHCGNARAVGEASTSYTMVPHEPDAAERIAAALPNVKLVYLIREPLSRIRSHYTHNIDRALESREFSEAVRADPRYLDTTRYSQQLERYRSRFSAEQLAVFDSDRLRHDRAACLREIFTFIGVDPDVSVDAIDRELNPSAEKRLAPGGVNSLRRWLRRTGGNRLLPKPLKQRLRLALSTEMPSDMSAWDAETEAWVLEQLEPDLRRLPALAGPEFGGWLSPAGG